MIDFGLGDVVELVSGSPPMTINALDHITKQGVTCFFFTGTKFQKDYFKLVELNRLTTSIPVEDFIEGQKVQLRSGGQIMMVEKLLPPSHLRDDPAAVMCKWWNGKEFQRENVKKHALKAAEEIEKIKSPSAE